MSGRNLSKRIQLVKVQSGKSRSGQAGSESCLTAGDRRERSVDSEKVGREDSAPKSMSVADAEAFILAEGNILVAVNGEDTRSRRSL